MERTVALLNRALAKVHEAAYLIELRFSSEEPEQRVKQKTAGFEKKNRKLERINKIFTGKELRMAKLKERIMKLEESVEGSMKR